MSKSPLKAVLIVGPNRSEIQQNCKIKAIYSQQDYLIIGDGLTSSVSKEEILSSLKDNIDSNTRIDIYAHGCPTEDDKKILSIGLGWEEDCNAENLFELLSYANNHKPLNLHVWTCFGGLATKSLRSLPKGSLLFTHVNENIESLTDISIYSFSKSIEEWSKNQTSEQGKNASAKFLKTFLNNLAFESFEVSSVSTWKIEKDMPKEYKLEMMPTLKDVLKDPKAVLEKLSYDYIKFCNDSFGISLNSPDLSEVAEEYRIGYLLHHFNGYDEDNLLNALREIELPESFFDQHLNNLTLLHVARSNKKAKLLKFLLQEKKLKADFADLIFFNEDMELDIGVLETLLECGLDLNISYKGLSLIELVVIHGQFDILKFCLENGAVIDVEKMNLFFHAINSPDMLKFLLERESPEEQYSKYGITPLHKAVYLREKSTLEILLQDTKIDVDQADKNQLTPLLIALIASKKDIVELLLNYRADPNITNKEGKTALHLVSTKGDTDIAKLLIASKADISKLDKYGHAALHEAINYAHVDMVRLLIQNGADVNFQDNYGYTLLYYAATHNSRRAEIVELLLEAGANPLVKVRGLGILDNLKENQFNAPENQKIIQLVQESIEKLELQENANQSNDDNFTVEEGDQIPEQKAHSLCDTMDRMDIVGSAMNMY